MLSRLFWLLTLWPLVECVVLAWIASKTSWTLVVGLVVGTGLAGAAIVRRHGWRTAQRIQSDLAAGRAPAAALVDGMLVFVAGALLILPGVVSDVVALALLLPPTREWVKRYLGRRFRVASAHGFSGAQGWSGPTHDQIIDVRVIESPRPADHS